MANQQQIGAHNPCIMASQQKDLNRSAAQLLRTMRNWRLRAWWGTGMAVVCAAGILACWYFQARGFWWLLSILGVVSALIGVLADNNAYYGTRQRIAEIKNPTN
jgi:hypothetical protein